MLYCYNINEKPVYAILNGPNETNRSDSRNPETLTVTMQKSTISGTICCNFPIPTTRYGICETGFSEKKTACNSKSSRKNEE